MSVGSSVQLPNQPAAGRVEEFPLAGAGYTSPLSETRVRLELDADATGGFMTATIVMDPRWTSIIAYHGVEVGSLADSKALAFNIQVGEFFSLSSNVIVAKGVTGGTVPPLSVGTWTPPGQLLFGPGLPNWTNNIITTTDNTDTEDLVVNCLIYNFKKDASKVVPLAVLYRCLPRGTAAGNL